MALVGTIVPDNTLSFRNRIINGDMRIDQRNAGASVTPTASIYALDRWLSGAGVTSKYSVQQNAGSVTPPAGFTNYLGVTSLSSYASNTSDFFLQSQYIEGLNVADLAWGTASAKTITVSFWVRSSLTGTFSFSVCNKLATRNYIATYTVSSANTWEYKTVTITGDTGGTWDTDNSIGIQLRFDIGSGSGFEDTGNVWTTNNRLRTSGSQSVVGTNGATWYITGVQLEVGSVATPFERRPYGTELALCQRYFELFGQSGVGRATAGNSCDMCFNFSVPKRATATIALFKTALDQVAEATVSLRTVTAITIVYVGNSNGILITFVVGGGGMTSPNMIVAYPNNYKDGFLSASAEL